MLKFPTLSHSWPAHESRDKENVENGVGKTVEEEEKNTTYEQYNKDYEYED